MRIFIQIVLPLLAPIAIYFIWAYTDAKRRGKGLPSWENGNWFWAILVGILLTILTMLYFTTTGSDTDATYESPRLKDGKVVPGQHK